MLKLVGISLTPPQSRLMHTQIQGVLRGLWNDKKLFLSTGIRNGFSKSWLFLKQQSKETASSFLFITTPTLEWLKFAAEGEAFWDDWATWLSEVVGCWNSTFLEMLRKFILVFIPISKCFMYSFYNPNKTIALELLSVKIWKKKQVYL